MIPLLRKKNVNQLKNYCLRTGKSQKSLWILQVRLPTTFSWKCSVFTKSATGTDQVEIPGEYWVQSVHVNNATEKNSYVLSQNNKTAIVFQTGRTPSKSECSVTEANPLSSLLRVQTKVSLRVTKNTKNFG